MATCFLYICNVTMINSLNRYIMKRMFSVFLLITVWLLVTPFLQAQSHVDKVLKDEITSDLKENILSFGKDTA